MDGPGGGRGRTADAGLYSWPQSEVRAAGDPDPRSDSQSEDSDFDDPEDDPDEDDPDFDDPDEDDPHDEAPGFQDPDEDEPADDDGGSGLRSGPPTADDRGTSSDGDEDGDAADDDPTGPVVGELTGLGLVIGSFEGGRSLELVVLDTGEIFELPNLRGRPVGRIGTTLIAADYGEVLALDLTTPDGEPETVVDFADGWIQMIEVDGDLIRTIQDDESGSRLLALTVDGELVEEVDLSTSPFGFGRPLTSAGGDIVQSGSGGVYRRTGDSYQRLSTGRIRAAGREIVLVEECDDRMRCESTWYEQRTWDPVGHPDPSLPADATGLVAGGDRWLLSTKWRTGQTRVIDIESGRSVRDIEGNRFFGYGPTSPISDDGRWLVDRDGIDAVVVDLETGKGWPLEVSLLGESATLWIDVAGTTFE